MGILCLVSAVHTARLKSEWHSLVYLSGMFNFPFPVLGGIEMYLKISFSCAGIKTTWGKGNFCRELGGSSYFNFVPSL